MGGRGRPLGQRGRVDVLGRAFVAAQPRLRAGVAVGEPSRDAAPKPHRRPVQVIQHSRRRSAPQEAAPAAETRAGPRRRQPCGGAAAGAGPSRCGVGAVALGVAGAARKQGEPSQRAKGWKIDTAITDPADSASARTFGSFAASSRDEQQPDRLGSAPSSSEAAAHASATPRAFGVAGTSNAPQPSRPASPSFSASAATTAPPRPCGPDQIGTTRSASPISSTLATTRAPARRAFSAEIDDRRAVPARRRRALRRRSPPRSPTAAAGTRRARPDFLGGTTRCAGRVRCAAASRARTRARSSRSRRARRRRGRSPRVAAAPPRRARRPTTRVRSRGGGRAASDRQRGRRRGDA